MMPPPHGFADRRALLHDIRAAADRYAAARAAAASPDAVAPQ